LIPRARIGSRELTKELDAAGLLYDDIPVYDTQFAAPGAVDVAGLLAEKEGLYVAFTSASTVRGFAAMAGGADCSRVRAVCIGEQTAAEAARLGMEVYVSDEITVDSLAEKIAELHGAFKER
jgi:uroporphyrinogen III methyltransferase/synthase